MERLDDYTELPSGMKEYLSYYGWHFSKKMYEFAISKMKDRNGVKIKQYTKDEIETSMKNNSCSINSLGYDAEYVYCMARSDFFGSSILNESGLCKYVKDYINDVDGYDGIAFTRFYADCMAKGIPIIWDDLI